MEDLELESLDQIILELENELKALGIVDEGTQNIS